MNLHFPSFVFVVLLVLVSSVLGSRQLNDTKKYPACIDDTDCIKTHRLKDDDYACFQYFCYPWKNKDGPLKLCQRDKDCASGTRGAGGGGRQVQQAECVRHYDRRAVTSGVCMAEVVECGQHEECGQNSSGNKKCCNGYCCSDKYYEAMQELPCQSDDFCQVILK
jgi:hypothetical protein